MRKQLAVFIVRWALNSFGIWLAVKLFGTGYAPEEIDSGFGVFLIAGLVFSLVNTVLRPITIILSLPAILLTLGLFTFIVNGFMVYISLMLAPGLSMTFWYSVLAGMLISLINYVVSSLLQLNYEAADKKEKSNANS